MFDIDRYIEEIDLKQHKMIHFKKGEIHLKSLRPSNIKYLISFKQDIKKQIDLA